MATVLSGLVLNQVFISTIKKRNIPIHLHGVIFQIRIKDLKKKEKQFRFPVWFLPEEISGLEQTNLLPQLIPDFNLGGVYVFDRRFYWERIYKRDGLGGNGIYSMCRVGNYIWVGVYEFDKQNKIEYGKGLFLINRITRLVTEVDLNQLDITSSTILSFHFDGTYLWIGTGEGLVRLKIENKLAEWPKKK